VYFSVAPTAKSDEVAFHVVPQMATQLNVMDLQIFGIAAALASPAIALEYLLAKPLIRVPI
jgi:hypothetical protein